MHYFIICSVGNYDEYINPYYLSVENSLSLDSCHMLQEHQVRVLYKGILYSLGVTIVDKYFSS